MRDPVSVKNYAIAAIGMFGMTLIGLKFYGVVSWPWWLVTLPFWGGLVGIVVLLLLVLIVAIGRGDI